MTPIRRGTARRLTLAPPPMHTLGLWLAEADLPQLTGWQKALLTRNPRYRASGSGVGDQDEQ